MILTIAFLSSVLMCANVFAAASGRCGDSITWTLDDSGNLTLSGSGEMWNYGIVTSPFKDYGIKTVTIGDGITSIGDYAFYSCRGLTELTLPNSVTSIGGCAFEGCNGLTELTLPNTLERIVASAFRGCSGLTELTLPSSVTRIEKNAFSDCSGLEKIISLAEIPPVCGSGGVFYGVNKTNCELIVPVISVIAYKLAEVWNEFSNISGFSGVEDTVADGNTIRVIGNQIEISGYFTSVEVYGINGALIYKGKDNVVTVPSAGIYLVHVADKTRKIVVE